MPKPDHEPTSHNPNWSWLRPQSSPQFTLTDRRGESSPESSSQGVVLDKAQEPHPDEQSLIIVTKPGAQPPK